MITRFGLISEALTVKALLRRMQPATSMNVGCTDDAGAAMCSRSTRLTGLSLPMDTK